MASMHLRKNQRYSYVIILLVGLFLVAAISLAYGNQPHMDNALRHLQAAKVELEKASPNKGGHRDRAMQLVDQAINQVVEGIRSAK
jgi:hypothetical protein